LKVKNIHPCKTAHLLAISGDQFGHCPFLLLLLTWLLKRSGFFFSRSMFANGQLASLRHSFSFMPSSGRDLCDSV
jgi:hypothetical protein